MIDKEKVKVAKEWIDKLANGINPLNGEVIKGDDIVNNVHISRCLFFVSEVLGASVAKPKKENTRIRPFSISMEDVKKVALVNNTGIANFVRAINNGIPEDMKLLSASNVLSWLRDGGYMEEVERDENHKTNLPTAKGIQLGITTQERDDATGRKYTSVDYNSTAQAFILEHIQDIIQSIK